MTIYQSNDREGAEPLGFPAEHTAGCLLGGAVGEALALSVKCLSSQWIHRNLDRYGVCEPVCDGGHVRVGEATQLTAFTADGLLRAIVCDEYKTDRRPVELIHQAYLRWLHSQGLTSPYGQSEPRMNGWLAKRPAMQRRHAVDDVTVAALASGHMGSVVVPINDCQGCGAAYRVAPIGLVRSITECFALGADSAAVTHGHPSSYLSAGMFAAMIHALMEGMPLEEAVTQSLDILRPHAHSEPVSSAIERAVRMSHATVPATEIVEFLGKGYEAHEALAIAVYAAMSYQDNFVAALRFAANHSGNCAATAAMTGSLMGAMLGRDVIPEGWLEKLELREELEVLATDLSVEFVDGDEWFYRYPGW